MDAVSNRDFVLDYLSAAATCATHLSQLGAEIVLWSSEEFGFCEVADDFASGSSIMPQKKNPDAAELLRAKAPRIAGHLVALHGVLHRAAAHLQQGHAGGQGAPLRHRRHDRAVARGRHRDDPRADLRSRGDARGRLRRAARGHGRRRSARSQRACRSASRTAIVAGLVRACARERQAAVGDDEQELAELAPALDGGFYDLLREGAWLESKVSEGGTSLARVDDQLAQARHVLEEASG